MLDLLKYMQQDGYLSANELVALKRTSKELGENPVRLLRSLNIASPEQIQGFLQKHFKVLILKQEALDEVSPDYQIFIPIDIAIFYSCFGIGEDNKNLYVAMEDPSDRGLINQLRFLLNKRVIGVSATVYQLAEGLTKIYHLPVSNLRLTTALEKSRGVLGGVRYHKEKETVVEINEDFEGAGLKDEVDFSSPPIEQIQQVIEPVKNIVLEKKEEIPSPPKKEEPPAFDFIDGSSGTVDPKFFDTAPPIENISFESNIESLEKNFNIEAGIQPDAPPPPMVNMNAEPPISVNNTFAFDETESVPEEGEELSPLNQEEPNEISMNSLNENSSSNNQEETNEISMDSLNETENENSSSNNKEETNEISMDSLNENELPADENILSENELPADENILSEKPEDFSPKISSLINLALTKLILVSHKNKAVELMNTLLLPYKCSLEKEIDDNENFKLNGENFKIESSWNNLEISDNPIYISLLPVFKKIAKLK